ncbi:MAG: GNAT family N-acetyltransferase [Thermomicrobiales bacterium]
MTQQQYRIERLGRHHDRAAFTCGEDSLDTYLRQRARQDADRNVAAVFVLGDPTTDRVAGYYTLSSASVTLDDLPEAMRRALPRYPLVPVVLLGRLAIDRAFHGQGLDEVLLYDALQRAFTVGTREIAAMAVIVDALHDRARGFYEQYGFQRFPSNEYRLFLPMTTIAQLLAEGDA